jgi:hypothetical protein
MSIRYWVGSWIALVAEGRFVAVPPSTPDRTLAHLWDEVSGTGGFAGVLDVLAMEPGLSLTACRPSRRSSWTMARSA